MEILEQGPVATILDSRRVSDADIALYCISSYQESHHLHTKHTILYATKEKKWLGHRE